MLLPIQCEYYALEGVSQLMDTIGRIKAHLNPTLDLSTVLLLDGLALSRASADLRVRTAEQVRPPSHPAEQSAAQ